MAPSAIREIPIIDVDTHYNEPHDLWTSRAPARLRDRVPQVKNVNGTDNLMFETDFPHPTCLYPGIQEHIERSLGHVSPESRRKILCDTAARVYHVPLPS